jgi:hypothetical protein
MSTTYLFLVILGLIITIAIICYLIYWIYLMHKHAIAQTHLLATIAEANKVKEETIQEILNEIKPNYEWYSGID